MLRERIFKSKVLISGVVITFSLLFFPLEGFTKTSPTGSMEGLIFDEDMTSPVENAVVKIRNSENGTEYQSNPTDNKGSYKIPNIPEGRYLIGVSTAKGDFNFDYELYVKANETAQLSLALKPGAAADESKKKTACFFTTPLGILVIIFAGGVLIYGGYLLTQEGGEKSPIKR